MMNGQHDPKVERLGEPVPLTGATVQEIQLELLRRTAFNNLDGERIARALLEHRDLWLSVMLDRAPIWNIQYMRLPVSWLVKMRDMPHNIWNADTLYIVSDSVEKARKLERIATGENHWGGEVLVYEKQTEIDRALGTGRHEHAIVTVWWD